MRVSVIVPTLDEADGIARTLAAVRQADDCEIIVTDGGSRDGTRKLARAVADRVICAPRGRARQMNAGARIAGGHALLFLHADSRPPDGFARLIVQSLADPAVVGGRFDVRLDAAGRAFRMIETLMNVRSRWTRIATGDQGIFVRAETFAALGGFPDWDLMEDVEFSRRLKRRGRLACLRPRVCTSARRWQRHGVIRTIMLMWGLRLAHCVGVPPGTLKAFYTDAR